MGRKGKICEAPLESHGLSLIILKLLAFLPKLQEFQGRDFRSTVPLLLFAVP